MSSTFNPEMKRDQSMAWHAIALNPSRDTWPAEASNVNETHYTRSNKEEKMKTMYQTTAKKEKQVIFSTLWIFTLFNYVYADIYALFFNPVLQKEETKQLLSGSVGSIQITQGFVLVTAILMETAIAMVLLSQVLPYRVNRWANILVGIFQTALVAWSLFGGMPNLFTAFFATIEMACMLFIVCYAWTWPHPEREVPTSASSGHIPSLQREQEETKRKVQTGSEDAHLAGSIGDTTPST
jgi:hypothetical protein